MAKSALPKLDRGMKRMKEKWKGKRERKERMRNE